MVGKLEWLWFTGVMGYMSKSMVRNEWMGLGIIECCVLLVLPSNSIQDSYDSFNGVPSHAQTKVSSTWSTNNFAYNNSFNKT